MRATEEDLQALVEALLQAWSHRRWTEVESILHEDVELLSFYEPGRWECHGPREVVEFLAQHHPVTAAGSGVTIDQVDDETLVVSPGAGGPGDTGPDTTAATVITIRDGKVVCMQRYRDRDEALGAAGAQ